jgi:NAD(P)H-dependent FMN reductase
MSTDPSSRPETHLTIPVILGSVRSGRQSERPAHLIVERLQALGHEAPLLDLRALNLPVFGQVDAAGDLPAVQALQATVAAGDALVILTPEYNHSFTSAVKNAIDYLHSEIRRKPVAVCGLSGGGLGGARAVEQMKLVLIELHAVPIRDSVYFSDARNIFDAEGNLAHPEYIRRVDDTLHELAWYARALGWGREHVPIPARV